MEIKSLQVGVWFQNAFVYVIIAAAPHFEDIPNLTDFEIAEPVVPRCSVKMMFLENSQNL